MNWLENENLPGCTSQPRAQTLRAPAAMVPPVVARKLLATRHLLPRQLPPRERSWAARCYSSRQRLPVKRLCRRTSNRSDYATSSSAPPRRPSRSQGAHRRAIIYRLQVPRYLLNLVLYVLLSSTVGTLVLYSWPQQNYGRWNS